MELCAQLVTPRQVASASDASKVYTVLLASVGSDVPICNCVAHAIAKNRAQKKGETYNGVCKHVREVMGTACLWTDASGTPQQTASVCPACGGPTVDHAQHSQSVSQTSANGQSQPLPSPIVQPTANTPLRPMLANEVKGDWKSKLVTFAEDDEWTMEPKLDGHRIMLSVDDNGQAHATGRNGQASQHAVRFRQPAYQAELARLPGAQTVLDGELIGDTLHVFDLLIETLDTTTRRWMDEGHAIRRAALEALFGDWAPDRNLFRLVANANDHESKTKLALLCYTHKGEGVMVKHRDGTYKPGLRSSQTMKVKFVSEADLIVTGLAHQGKDNCVLSCYRDGKLVEVGRASTIGKFALDVGDVVVVRYLSLGAGDRIVQPRLMHKRTDKDANECSFDQLHGAVKNPLDL